VEIPVVLLVSKRRASISLAESRRLWILSSSINPTFLVALLLGGYPTSASVRRPISFTSPRPTGSALPVCLCLTSCGSASRPSLKVWRLRLILFKSGILLAVMALCLHIKPLDLLSRDLMLVFVRAQEDFLLWIPVHPTRLHRRHVFALLRRDFVFASTPTRRSGLVRHGYPWVPTD
jgi:hypothetical protein